MLTKEFKVSLKKKEKHTHFLKLHGSHFLHFLEKKNHWSRLPGLTFKTGKGQHSRNQVGGGGNKAEKENDRCPKTLATPQSI